MYLLYYEQNKHCTYNVALWCVRATIVAEEKQCYIFRKYVFVALGTQRQMSMRPKVICGFSVSTIFSYCLIKNMIFEKCFCNKKLCFDFFITFV